MRQRAAVIGLAFLVAGYGAFLGAWVMANPLGRAPDEPAHYVRAAGIGNGDITGQPVALTTAGYSYQQHAWQQQTVREFSLPARSAFLPVILGCQVANPTVSAACQQHWPPRGPAREPSTVGTYQPFTYAPAGVAIRLGPSPWSSFVLGRATMALGSLVLIGLAAAALFERRPSPGVLLGLLLAITPMALFLGATLNPSGIEIAAGLACVSGLMSLTRANGGRSLPGWAAFGTGGTVLAATRSVGPYFVVALAVLALLFGGARRVREATRARPWAAVTAGTCIAVAALANLAWEAAKQPHLTWGSVLDHATLGRLPSLGKELVGRFGILEWGLPWPIYALWGALVLVLVVAALVVGTWRQRAALAGLVALNVVLAIAFHSVLPAQTGFDVQGRYILPLAVGIPIVAAEIVHRRQRAGRVLVAAGAATGVVVAGLQFLAWYLNGRRYAVGTSGPRWFLGRAQWTPTGGWLAWLAVAAAGAVCLLAAAGTSLAPEALSRSRRRRSEPVATIAASA